MAELTTGDIGWIREWVGDDPDDVELNRLLNEPGVGDRGAVVKRVLAVRLANLLAEPASMSISGEYSQSTAANIEALREKLAQLNASGAIVDDTTGVLVVGLPPIQPR